jgi:two-component system, NtrC family, sensor kinase
VDAGGEPRNPLKEHPHNAICDARGALVSPPPYRLQVRTHQGYLRMTDLDELRFQLEHERTAREKVEQQLQKLADEHKSLTKQLQLSNDQLRRQVDRTDGIVQTAAEGVVTYDETGRITTFNRSAECMFDCTASVPCNIRDLFASNPGTEAVLFPDLRDGGTEQVACEIYHDLAEIRGLRRDGDSFIVEASVRRQEFEGQAFYIALVRDASKRKVLESRLTQARKMESVGQLAAGIAHEINTPIQFVSDNIQFLDGAFEDIGTLLDLYETLLERTRDVSGIQELVRRIDEKSELTDLAFLREEFPQAINQSLDGIQKVSAVVRALNDFSQPVTELVTAIDLANSIANLLTISHTQWQDVAEVKTEFPSDLPNFMGHPGHFNQTLLNLFANAIEAIVAKKLPGKGLIEIEAFPCGQQIELRISDNGIGIPYEIQHRVFDPFFTTKEVGKGIGQGLSVVYDVIVGKHDGIIDFVSEPEVGTTFTIKIPINGQTAQINRTFENAAFPISPAFV